MSNISGKTGKPKRQITEKQLAALAAGCQKRQEMRDKGIQPKSRSRIDLGSWDYMAGLVRGIEMDHRIAALEDKPYHKALKYFDDRSIIQLQYRKMLYPIINKRLLKTQVQKEQVW